MGYTVESGNVSFAPLSTCLSPPGGAVIITTRIFNVTVLLVELTEGHLRVSGQASRKFDYGENLSSDLSPSPRRDESCAGFLGDERQMVAPAGLVSHLMRILHLITVLTIYVACGVHKTVTALSEQGLSCHH
jgi:hypothetical protein